jgi:hypothetical protein
MDALGNSAMLSFLFVTLKKISLKIWGGFHKNWAHGVKHKVHPNLGENA